MAQNSFSIGEAVSFGWETTKKNLWFLVVTTLIVTVISVIPAIIEGQLPKDQAFFRVSIGIIGRIAEIIMSIGMIVISLKLIDGKKPSLRDLYIHYNLFLNYFVASILYGLIVLAGYILLIAPGVIWTVKYQFYGYYVIDKKMGPLEAIQASGKATQGHKWHLWRFAFVEIGIFILGFLALGIGILFAAPVAMIAVAYIYRKLAVN